MDPDRTEAVTQTIKAWLKARPNRSFFQSPRNVVAIIHRLEQQYGMRHAHFSRLHHMGHDSGTFIAYSQTLVRGYMPASGNVELGKRLACSEALRRQGFEWDEFLDLVEDHPDMPRICMR